MLRRHGRAWLASSRWLPQPRPYRGRASRSGGLDLALATRRSSPVGTAVFSRWPAAGPSSVEQGGVGSEGSGPAPSVFRPLPRDAAPATLRQNCASRGETSRRARSYFSGGRVLLRPMGERDGRDDRSGGAAAEDAGLPAHGGDPHHPLDQRGRDHVPDPLRPPDLQRPPGPLYRLRPRTSTRRCSP